MSEESENRLSLTIPFFLIILIAFLLNATTACLAMKNLKRKLHNLLIMCLWVNNGMVCFAVMVYKIRMLLVDEYDNKVTCQMLGIVLCYSLLTSYIVIFLIGWVRYVTIKTFNIGTEERLERHKWYVVIGTHIFSLVASVVVNVLLTTKAEHIESCSPFHVYADNYPIYMVVLWTPVTLFLFSVLMIYAVNSYYIWKIFFKQSMKINPLDITAFGRQRRKLSMAIELANKTGPNRDQDTVPVVSNQNKTSNEDPIGAISHAQINGKVDIVNGSEKEIRVEIHKDFLQKTSDAIDTPKQIRSCISCPKNDCATGRILNNKSRLEGTSIDIHHDRTEDIGNTNSRFGSTCTFASLSNIEIELEDNVDPIQSHQDRTDVRVEPTLKRQMNKDIKSSTNLAEKRNWEIRAFKTNMMIAVSTTVFSSPFIFSLWYELLSDDALPGSTRNVVFAFSIINYIFDPFYYAYRVPEIRKELRCRLCKT